MRGLGERLSRYVPREEWFGVGLASLLLAFMLSFFDLGIVAHREEANVPLFAGTYGTISDIYSWAPIFAKIAHGNLSPDSPSISPSSQAFAPLPYLACWTAGFFIWAAGFKGAWALGTIVLSGLSFILIYSIYRFHLNKLWALGLSFLSLTCFSALPFRDFFAGLLRGQLLATEAVPELGHFPLTSMTLVCFLALFRVSTAWKLLSLRRAIILTLGWTSLLYVHGYVGLVGLAFWTLYFLVLALRKQIKWLSLGWILALVGLVLVGLSPLVILYVSKGLSTAGLLGHRPGDSSVFGEFYVLAYFALPLFVSVFLYWFFHLDIHEYLVRFSPVFILLGLEFAVVLPYFFGISLAPSLMFTKLGVLFLHFYYLVPAIYFVTRKLPTTVFRLNEVYQKALRDSLVWFARWPGQALLKVLVPLFLLYGFTSGFHRLESFLNRERVAAPLKERYRVVADGLAEGDGVILPLPAENLGLPIFTQLSTTWVNRFCNTISSDSFMKRLVVYAKVNGTSEEEFVRWFHPGSMQIDPGGSVISLKREDLPSSGLVLWLMEHHRFLTFEELEGIRAKARQAYRDLDLISGLKMFSIRRVLMEKPAPDGLPLRLLNESVLGYLYQVEG